MLVEKLYTYWLSPSNEANAIVSKKLYTTILHTKNSVLTRWAPPSSSSYNILKNSIIHIKYFNIYVH